MRHVYRLMTDNGPKYYVHQLEDEIVSCWVEDDINMLHALLDGKEVVVDLEVDPESVNLDAILPPVSPSKVVCIGLNYAQHAKEMNKTVPAQPLMFLKPPTAILAHGGEIEYPPQSNMVHHEAELALIIGKQAKCVAQEDAMSYLLGYTCANDITARDIQRQENRYTRGKGFDTFCPIGPFMVSKHDYEPANERIQCRVNGKLRQDSLMNDLIFPIEALISFVSHVMTLMPGDIILTGTPMGVGPLEVGDQVEVEATGLGVLKNVVRAK